MNFFVCIFGVIWVVIFRIVNKVGHNRTEEGDNNLLQGFKQAKEHGENVYLHNFDLKRELHRKILHGLAVLYILGLFLHGLFALIFKYTYLMHPFKYSIEEYHNSYISVTGLIPVKSGFLGVVMGLIGSFFVQIHMEILRLQSPEIPGILKKVLQDTRRVTEVYTFSAHIPLIIGFLSSTLLLYINSVFRPQLGYSSLMGSCSVILTSSLSDLTACLIGRKWGRKRWRINDAKTILGTVSGAVVAFIISMFFVGWIAGFLSVAIFILVDVFSNKIQITDNLLYPIVLTVVFIIFLPIFTSLLPENWFFISLNITGG